jgi:hypothetical protein
MHSDASILHILRGGLNRCKIKESVKSRKYKGYNTKRTAYTMTLENYLKYTCLNTNSVNVNEKMVLGLL